MSQPPYPQGSGQPQYPQPNNPQSPQQQSPYQQNPYQQPPGGGPPRNGSGGSKTLLIVLGIVGAVIVLTVLICGIFGYLAVRNVQEGMASVMEEVMEQQKKMEKAEGEYWVEAYRDNEKVTDRIGTISSYKKKSPKYSGDGADQVQRIEIVGDKGTGELIVEEDYSEDDEDVYSVKTYLVFDGEKILIDEDASDEQDQFSYGYDYATGEFEDDVSYQDVGSDSAVELESDESVNSAAEAGAND